MSKRKNNLNTETKCELRNGLGYLNLKTKFWHHALIAVGGYILSLMLISIISSALIGLFIADGMDFSCIIGGESNGICNEESLRIYNRITMWSQAIAQLIVVAIVAGIFFKYLLPLFKQAKEKKTWVWVGICLVAMAIFDFSYLGILKAINANHSSANQEIVVSVVENIPFLGFVLIVLAGPLFEEVIFRFGVFRAFLNKGKKFEIVGLVVAVVLFALIHMEATLMLAFSGNVGANWDLILNDMLTLPSYLFISFVVTFSYCKTKNFLAPILIHVTWNLTQYVLIIISILF